MVRTFQTIIVIINTAFSLAAVIRGTILIHSPNQIKQGNGLGLIGFSIYVTLTSILLTILLK